MIHFLIRRLAGALLALAAVSFITFLLLATGPGDAADALVGEFASQEQLDEVHASMGLDAPFFQRYLDYMAGAALHWDMGDSLISGRPVARLIGERLPYTVILTLSALTLAALLGSITGLIAAARPGGWLDLGLMSLTTLGLSVPTFWAALLLIYFFSLKLGWLPVTGAGTPAHLVLPTLSLALPLTAMVARLMRASLLDVKEADYVRTARAKGLKPGKVWQGHILRNALIPVLTMLGVYAGRLLAGAVVIETVFGWPGLGRLTVQAVLDNDLPVVMGAVLLIAFLYQAINLGVDILHAWADPRVGGSAL